MTYSAANMFFFYGFVECKNKKTNKFILSLSSHVISIQFGSPLTHECFEQFMNCDIQWLQLTGSASRPPRLSFLFISLTIPFVATNSLSPYFLLPQLHSIFMHASFGINVDNNSLLKFHHWALSPS